MTTTMKKITILTLLMTLALTASAISLPDSLTVSYTHLTLPTT